MQLRLPLLSLLIIPGLLHAADFPPVYNSDPGDPQPTSPQDALSKLNLPKGFSATLFAAEPEVRNPIGMAWDAKGRMWVAENYTYAERQKRFDLSLRDRVLILEDKDNDGVAESRKVFTEDVQMLTSVEVGRGGVWLMCPPQVLFIPDLNEDDVPDGPAEVVLDGFTVAKDNYHNFANGLRWGPDGWLYGRCGHSCPGRIGVPGTPNEKRVPLEGGIWRFHPRRQVFEVLSHGTTNPWGHDWDRFGEAFFINTVNGHLWHMIPGAHFVEGGSSPNPGVYERIDTHADHWHFDTKGSWSDSRDGKANSLGGGHAHIGMMIYQGAQWPEVYRNKLFTLNMHGRRANVERLERHGSGYVGKHEPDVFLSNDPWFRGIEISTGPDGSAFILDWSDTGECHESTGVHRTSGRIFKISHGQSKGPDLKDLATLTPEAITRIIRNPNAWHVRQLRTVLAGMEINDGFEGPLEAILKKEKDPVLRLRALWTLNAMGFVTADQLRPLLHDPDEHMRAWAIRLLTDAWPLDTILGPQAGVDYPFDDTLLHEFKNMARSDKSPLVRLALASTLQRLPVSKRSDLAQELTTHGEDATDHNLPAMVWYGLIPVGESDPQSLVNIAQTCRWPKTVRWIARNLASRIETQSAPLEALLTSAQRTDLATRTAITEGVNDALKGWRKAPRPKAWDAFATTLANDGDDALKATARDLSALFGDGQALDEVKKVVLDGKAELPMRIAALKTLIENRPPDLRELCLSLLEVRGLNATAARGLSNFDEPEIGERIAANYRKFATHDRAGILEVLSSRPTFAKALLKEVAANRIPRTDVSAFHARQILAFKDQPLTEQLTAAWGELRDSSADKVALIKKLKADLTLENLAKANLSNGRMLFQICSACHIMYGEGGKVGPDLTGSGRANLDYLLENIVEPSAVVTADFRMTILTLKDGRILSGVVARQDARTLTLRLLTEETTIEKAEIAKQEASPVSMMPEGLLLALQPDQVRDLIAYLMHPSQVPLPGQK
ncbi:MAG TPA: PVC-type heme-binding CxxCH protein [Prosthecobacter sp.]|nr:PVC-type heme-binding CxxCH protein [Prosthecobacter sp.]